MYADSAYEGAELGWGMRLMLRRSWGTESKSDCPPAREGSTILRGLPAEAEVTGTEPYGASGAVVVAGARDGGCCAWRSRPMGLEASPGCDATYRAWLEGAVVDDAQGLLKCGEWVG